MTKRSPKDRDIGPFHPSEADIDPRRYESAPDFESYLAGVREHRSLWTGVYARVRISDEQIAAGRALTPAPKLLALSEDWCGDAANTLPVAARFAEAVGWELRALERDRNLDIMDAHLTNGRSRSIPVVIGYDSGYREIGWWGPRPHELQEWMLSEEARSMAYDDRYKVARRWYAKDRGKTTVAELLAYMEPEPRKLRRRSRARPGASRSETGGWGPVKGLGRPA